MTYSFLTSNLIPSFLVYKKYDEWIHFEKFWYNLVFTPITAGDSDNENVFVEVRSVEDQTKLV